MRKGVRSVLVGAVAIWVRIAQTADSSPHCACTSASTIASGSIRHLDTAPPRRCQRGQTYLDHWEERWADTRIHRELTHYRDLIAAPTRRQRSRPSGPAIRATHS
jgi:hypothetical protein